MKRELLLAALLTLGALVILPEPVSASTNCALPVTNVCQGWAQVSTKTGGVLGTDERCFSVKTVNSAPACATTTSNLAWEMDAGACVTLYYFDTANGVTAPAVPNKVSLTVRQPSELDQKVLLSNAAEPANGASFTFCATTTGSAGGANRAGTWQIFLTVIKDNGAGGIGNYNINSQGTASVGAVSTFDKGALRSLQHVSSIARSAYPSGSTFAFGPAGNEQVTVTATFDPPNNDKGTSTAETSNTGFVTYNGGAGGPQGAGGAASDETIGQTTLAQSATVDNTNTPFANSPYVPYYQVDSNAALTGLPWTGIPTTGNGATVVRFAATFAYDSTTFNVDPRIVFDSDGVGTFATADDMGLEKLTSSSGTITSLFNRGEVLYAEFYIFNARGEQLTRAMTIDTLDASNTVCVAFGSITPTSGKYSGISTIPTGGSCTVANTVGGSPRYYRATATNQAHTSLQSYTVSSLYFIDAHIQLSATLNKDNYPTENANEDVAYIISNAQTDTTHGWCHVVSVRKDLDIDTSGSVLTWSYIDPLSTTRLTGTTDTGADGWTATHLDLLASTPLGAWTFRCAIASGAPFNGNFGTNDQAFTVSVPSGGSGAQGDPLRIWCSPGLVYASDSILCAISESNSDGSGRTGNAAGTLFDLYNPSNTLIVTGGAATEVANGIYRYTYSVGGSPTLGTYLAVVRTTDASPVASSTAFTIRATPTVYATPADVTAAQTAINSHVDSQLATERNTINAHTDSTVASAQSAILADTALIKADTAALLAKWGTTDAATIRSDISTLQGRIGASTDTSSAATVFGKIALAHEHSDANDATTQASIATLQATATATSTLLTDVHTELGAHGKSRTVFHVLEDIEAALASAGLTQSTAFDNLTADVHEMHQDVHEISAQVASNTFPTSLDLQGTATPAIVNNSILAAIIALIITAAIVMTTGGNKTAQLLGAPLGALAGFLALNYAWPNPWTIPATLLGFGVTAWGYISYILPKGGDV